MEKISTENLDMERLILETSNRVSISAGRDRLEGTRDATALPTQLDTLPGELISKIFRFTMASDVPVYFWLFLDFARTIKYREVDNIVGRINSSRPTSAFLYYVSLPKNQLEHLVDWRAVTSTSHRLRSFGKPAFFHTKDFIIPPTMLRALKDDKARSPNFTMAVEMIRHITVPVSKIVNGTDFMALPKYQLFACLSSLTISVGNVVSRILQAHPIDRPWPREPPSELLNLLRKLDLKVNGIDVKLVIIAEKEEEVPLCIDSIERGVYPLLRTLVRRRANPEDSPI